MSKQQNLPISLKAAKEFIKSMDGKASPVEQAAAARNLIDALKKSMAALEKGFNRKKMWERACSRMR